MIIVGSWEDSEELLEVYRISIVAEWVKEIAREECDKKGNRQNKKFGGVDE
jgi:hypothetical protein